MDELSGPALAKHGLTDGIFLNVQGRCSGHVRTVHAIFQNRSARRVRDVEAVSKITFAIMERMKRHGVQQAVTNDYNPPSLDDRSDRLDQLLVELLHQLICSVL